MNGFKLVNFGDLFRYSSGNKNWFLFEEKNFPSWKFCIFLDRVLKKRFLLKANQIKSFQSSSIKLLNFKLSLIRTVGQINSSGFFKNRSVYLETNKFVFGKGGEKKKERRCKIFLQTIDLKFRSKKNIFLKKNDSLNRDPLLMIHLRCFYKKNPKNFHFFKKKNFLFSNDTGNPPWKFFLDFLQRLEQETENSSPKKNFQCFKKKFKVAEKNLEVPDNDFLEIFKNIYHFYLEYNQKSEYISDQLRKKIYYKENPLKTDFNLRFFSFFFSQGKIHQSKKPREDFKKEKNNLRNLVKNLKFVSFYTTEFGNSFFSKKARKVQYPKPLYFCFSSLF